MDEIKAPTENQPAFYAVIPLEVLENKALRPNSKLLYAEISALTRKDGICRATNSYLADRLGLDNATSVKPLLSELKDQGYIDVDIERGDGGTWREITLTVALTVARGSDKKHHPPALNNATKGEYNKQSITKESTDATGSTAKKFLDWYCQEYFNNFKDRDGKPIKYIVSGAKDMALLKKLLQTIQEPELKELALKFFKSPDDWIQTSGHTIGVFYSQINKLRSAKPGSLAEREKRLHYVPKGRPINV